MGNFNQKKDNNEEKRDKEVRKGKKTVVEKVVRQKNVEEEAVEKKEIDREVLSIHETHAVYKGRVVQRNNFWKSPADNDRYPPTIYQDFAISDYLRYESKAKLCDKEKTQQGFVEGTISDEIMGVIKTLENGDEVILYWNHEYVTVEKNSQTLKYPERRIIKLEKR